MRFPFVSRATLDSEIARGDLRAAMHRHTIDTLRELLAKEEQRSSHLMDTVIAMKLSGGSVQRLSPLEPGQKLAQPKRSRIQQAIDECPAAATNKRQRDYLDAWAAKEIERGTKEEDILDRIRRFSIVSEEDDDEDGDNDVIEL